MTVSYEYLQGITGLSISLFAVPHFVNTALAIFGPSIYEKFQDNIRIVYKNPVVEAGLLISILSHILVGWLKYFRDNHRKNNGGRVSLRSQIHRYSGYFLDLSIFFHVLFTTQFERVGFGGLSYSVTSMPWLYIPYYSAFGIAGVLHLLLGLPKAFLYSKIDSSLSPSPISTTNISFSAMLMFLGVLSFTGAFHTLPDYSQHPFALFQERLKKTALDFILGRSSSI